MKFKAFMAAMSFFLPVTISQAATYDFTPSDQALYVASEGEVVLTFLSKTALYSNDLFLNGSSSVILNNQTAAPGSQYSLGSFQAGQSLSFAMLVNNTGFIYQMGAASNNADNFLHVAYQQATNQPLIVGFEDLHFGGDKDYDDLVFSISNVKVGNIVSSVPEPGQYAMLVAGLGMFGFASKRRNKNQEDVK